MDPASITGRAAAPTFTRRARASSYPQLGGHGQPFGGVSVWIEPFAPMRFPSHAIPDERGETTRECQDENGGFRPSRWDVDNRDEAEGCE